MILVEGSEIIPNLWQGSFPEPGPEVAKSGFKLLVLCAEELQFEEEDYPGVRVLRAPNTDDDSVSLSRALLATAVAAAREVVTHLQANEKVLVTCAAGLNRSALVTAISLHLFKGWDGETCVQVIRTRRKHKRFVALSNTEFVKAIRKLNMHQPKVLPPGWSETPGGLILPED